jgi:hypothetical protein
MNATTTAPPVTTDHEEALRVGPQDHGRVDGGAVDQRAVEVEDEQRVAFPGLVEQRHVQARGEACVGCVGCDEVCGKSGGREARHSMPQAWPPAMAPRRENAAMQQCSNAIITPVPLQVVRRRHAVAPLRRVAGAVQPLLCQLLKVHRHLAILRRLGSSGGGLLSEMEGSGGKQSPWFLSCTTHLPINQSTNQSINQSINHITQSTRKRRLDRSKGDSID